MATQVSAAGTDARQPALDGLRGLAVAAVLCFHAPFSWARGGYLGVSAFFTLSGFLITTLLLQQHARSGRISFRRFWSRRARRLLPAGFLAVAAVLLYGATIATNDQARALRWDVLSALGAFSNWRFYFSGRAYAALFSAPSPVQHFWSLAIEAQFYVVFPVLVAVVLRATRGRRGALAAVLGACTAGSLALSYALDNGSANGVSRVYYGTDTRAAELLIGALLATALFGRRPARSARATRALASIAGPIALVAMSWWWATVDQASPWLYHGGLALHAGLTAVVIAAVCAGGPLSAALSWRPLETLGRWSYGVYVYHWPIFLWLSHDRTGLSTLPLFVARVASTLAAAGLSYTVVERRILEGRRLPRPGPRILVPATAGALVASALVVTASPPAPAIVLASVASRHSATDPKDLPAPRVVALPDRRASKPAATTTTTPHLPPLFRAYSDRRRLRILVVGDSVGVTLGRGFELWGRETGLADVVNLAHLWCPLGREIPAVEGLSTESSLKSCDWSNWWPQAIRDFNPDVTVVLFTIWESAPRMLPGDSHYSRPGDPALDAWQLSEYEAAADTLSARGAPVVWLTDPCGRGQTPPRAPQPLWVVKNVTLPKLAAARPAVHIVDDDSYLCPNGIGAREFGGVQDPRPDGTHFSDAGAVAFVNWLMPIIAGQAPVPAPPAG